MLMDCFITKTVKLVFLILIIPASITAGDFFAYYSRLDHEDTPERQISGAYTDIIVSLDAGKLVFSRKYSYLPYWSVGDKTWLVDEIVERKGDGPPERPDNINRSSHVRIVENNSEKIVIHWRYAPDITSDGFTNFEETYSGAIADYFRDYVDEYFEIMPDGRVERTIRQSHDKIDVFLDDSNTGIQKFKLAADGILNKQIKVAEPSDQPGEAVEGAKVIEKNTVKPVAWWKFDDGLIKREPKDKYFTIESINGRSDAVAGNTVIYRAGVSGTAMVFDGYESCVTIPSAEVPALENAMSIEAWIAPQEYSWNRSAIVDHGRRRGLGYSLSINHLGQIGFNVNVERDLFICETEQSLPLHKWSHIVAVFDSEFGLRVYINGNEAAKTSAPGRLSDLPEADLYIGMTRRKTSPVLTERRYSQSLSSKMIFDGLLDEVRIYDKALSAKQIAKHYNALKPKDEKPLEYRVLNAGPRTSKFGAQYTKLQYHPSWDNMWRVEEHPDIVVNFDLNPTQMVFWRGTIHGLACVTDNNIWVSDQSAESWNRPKGCSEHMSDKINRFSHVRLIENTDARVLVHWRVASNTVDYLFNSENDDWGEWTDEYYYIYPDGIAVRYQEIHGNPPQNLFEVQQHEMLNQPGTWPEDNGESQLITVVNMTGETERWTWENDAQGERLDKRITDPVIEYMNLKSKYKHFVIGEVGSEWEKIPGYGAPEGKSNMNCWNHWPVALLPSDGRVAPTSDRPSSTCVGTLQPVRHDIDEYMQIVRNLYGLTDKEPAELAQLARSWNNAPQILDVNGGEDHGYDKNQRAYVIKAVSDQITFSLKANFESPVMNPAIVIKNWGSDQSASLSIDGESKNSGTDFRQGIVRDTDGTPMLVMWIKLETDKPVKFELTRG